MRLVDPLQHPDQFVRQADALIRTAATAPMQAADPFAAIEQRLEASFAEVLAGAVSEAGEQSQGQSGLQTNLPQTVGARPSGALPDGATAPMASAAANYAINAMIEGAAGLNPYGVVKPGMWPMAPIASGTPFSATPFGMPAMPLISYAPGMVPVTGVPGATFAGQSQPPVAAVGGAAPTGSATPGAVGPDLEPLIGEMSAKYEVPAWLVRNVIRQESGGNPNARSPVGAMGLMQLMPMTAADLGVTNPYDARQNMEGGVKYLKQMLTMFGGDYQKAVAAYNAGPGAVQRYGGVPPYAETQNYVKRILG